MHVFPEDADGVLSGGKDGKEGADIGIDAIGGDEGIIADIGAVHRDLQGGGIDRNDRGAGALFPEVRGVDVQAVAILSSGKVEGVFDESTAALGDDGCSFGFPRSNGVVGLRSGG